MDCIFLTLQRIDYYSIILRGRLLPSLAKKYKIVVLTPDLDDEAAGQYGYFQHENVIYKKTAVRYAGLLDRSDRLRRYLVRTYDDLATTRFSYYWAQNRWERIFILCGALAPKKIVTQGLFTRLEAMCARPPKDFKNLVREYRPKLMLVPTPGYKNAPFITEHIHFAKNLGIPSVAIYQSFDNPYSQPKFLRQTDYIFVWSERMKQEVEKFHHYRSEQIYVVGSLKFDHHFNDVREKKLRSREEFLRSKNLDPHKRLVVYATTTSFFKSNKGLIRLFAEIKKQKQFDGDPDILVRLHPLEVWNHYEKFSGIPGVHIERAGTSRFPDTARGLKVDMTDEDLKNQTETFLYCDVLVNCNSTTVLEASLFDRPTVSIGWPPALKAVYEIELAKFFKESGAERNAGSPEEMIAFVNEYLAHPERDRGYRAKIVKDFVTFTDGRAYQRTVDAVGDILRRETSGRR